VGGPKGDDQPPDQPRGLGLDGLMAKHGGASYREPPRVIRVAGSASAGLP